MSKNRTLVEDRDYRIMDINIKAGIAFTLVSLAIVLLVLLISKQA